MKVIKRNGMAVDYDMQKIAIAIGKANKEVIDKEKATNEEIKAITEYIEALGKKRMLVEDIQDIIEEKLMEFKKYKLAKKYIVYRYTRALVRKQNTTDESILGLIRDESKYLTNDAYSRNSILASSQRNYIASEVSCDLTKRLLLPEKITEAQENGILHFHNADYFIQPIINSSTINLETLLKNDIAINNYTINNPRTFIEACLLTAEIILDIANNQYGNQKVNISCLGEYLNKNINELNIGIKLLVELLNTILSTSGRIANVKFLINTDENYNYFKENCEIFNEIKKYTNSSLLIEKISNNTAINYGEFDQGKVTINLVQIGIISEGDENKFWKELDIRLDLCREALMYKHYALLGTLANVSPILWINGGISTLKPGERIDSLLKNGVSTLTLAYVGIKEVVNILEDNKSEDSKNSFKEKIINKIIENTNRWKEEVGIKFLATNETTQKLNTDFLKIDKEKFGIIKNITDKGFYEINN